MAKSSNRLSTREFLELVEQYRDELFRYILRQAWDPQVAEDVFASSVLAAFENVHKFQPGTNFRAWMYRIITNKVFVANRHTGRRFDSLDESGADRVPEPERKSVYDVVGDPETVLEEVSDEVLAAMQSLSDNERACILLRGVEGFSYKEIAEILEMPTGTVMTHLSRGRAKLRRELGEYARASGVIKSDQRGMNLGRN